MDKLMAIRIKYDSQTYSDEIPIGILAENVQWDESHVLTQVLGQIDLEETGSIQDQIDSITELIGSSVVQTINGKTGEVTLTATDIDGIPVIDTTLSHQSEAADAKAVGNALSLKADIVSPTFTGTPKAPTPTSTDNSTKIATTSFVQSKYNTLQSGINSIQNTLNNKANKASPALTGIPTAPTPAAGTNNTQIATTAFVKNSLNYNNLSNKPQIGGTTLSGNKTLASLGIASLSQVANLSSQVSTLSNAVSLNSTAVTSAQNAISNQVTRATTAEASKINKPSTNPNGTEGQYLQSDGQGGTSWVDVSFEDQITDAVNDWLDDHVTPGGSTIVVDATLSVTGAAADAKVVGDELTDIKSDLSDINTATSSDEGKALKAKTVTNGKVTEWQFGEIGGGGTGGTSNYNELSNKPQINGVTITGNKSGSDFDLVDIFIVNIIIDDGSIYSVDKTYAQIVAAILAGKHIYALVNDVEYEFCSINTEEDFATFRYIGFYDWNEGQIYQQQIRIGSSSNSIIYYETDSPNDVIAPEFSTSISYTAGQYCRRYGILYRFKNNHSAGAWSGSDVDAITIGEALTSLSTELDNKLDSPQTAGTNGQVLTSNGQGGAAWQSVSSFGPSVPITTVLISNSNGLSVGDTVTFAADPKQYSLFTFKASGTAMTGYASWVSNTEIRGMLVWVTNTPNVFITVFGIDNISGTTGTLSFLESYNKNLGRNETRTLVELTGIGIPATS